MYNFMFSKYNDIIFPAYLSKEERSVLRKKMGNDKEYMYCSCHTGENRLYYQISSDLRIIPCHQGYVHKDECVRNISSKRKTAYVNSDDNVDSVVYMSFNPCNFSIPKFIEDDTDNNTFTNEETEAAMVEESKTEKPNSKREDKPDKEPFYGLGEFIRALNYDTFMERSFKNKSILSMDYFSNALWARLKSVRIASINKPIRELDINNDGFVFFYSKLITYYDKNKAWYMDISAGGKERTYFVFEKILKKVTAEYVKNYGSEPNTNKDTVFVAGFVYKKISSHGKAYFTPGRFHFFRVNNNGIYVRNDVERAFFNELFKYISINHIQERLYVLLPLANEPYFCQIRVKNSLFYANIFYNKIPSDYREDEHSILISCKKEPTNYKDIELIMTKLHL